MKLLLALSACAVAANAIQLNGSPGSIIGGGGSGSAGSSSSGASAITSSDSTSGGLMSTLKSLISEINSANAGAAGAGATGGELAGGAGASGASAAGTAASIAGGATGAASAASSAATTGSSGEASARSKFVTGQLTHFAAANPLETPEEIEVESAIRSAMSTPSSLGAYPNIGAELSRGATSFMRFDADSYLSGAKISPSDLEAIGSAVEAATNQFLTRSSGCGACKSGVNWGACPSGFTESRNGECQPSPSYKGFCTRSIDIGSF